MRSYEELFIFALSATVVIEIAAAAVVSRAIREELPARTLLPAVAAASVLTLPYVWFVIPSFTPRAAVTPVVEAFAVLTEVLFYRLFVVKTWSRAALYSVAANLCSYLLGVWYWTHYWYK